MEQPSASGGLAGTREWLVRLIQLALSLVVLWVLSRDMDMDRLQAVVSTGHAWAWLGLGLGGKALTVILHELRLWLAFEHPRPPAGQVFQIGFVAALANLVLPARAGDVLAIGLLRRRCQVSTPRATAAVGLVGFLEIAVFGVLVVGILAGAADRWTLALGAAAHVQAMQLTSLLTLAAVAIGVVLVVLAKRLGPPEDSGLQGAPGPVALLRDTARAAGSSLASRRWLGIQLSTAALQAPLMIAAFVLGFEAAGLEVELPWLAASGIMALSGVAGVVLPSSFGAGPAAASLAVLTVFGVDQTDAMLYAAAWWAIQNLPSALLGLPALWLLGRRPRSA